MLPVIFLCTIPIVSLLIVETRKNFGNIHMAFGPCSDDLVRRSYGTPRRLLYTVYLIPGTAKFANFQLSQFQQRRLQMGVNLVSIYGAYKGAC